MTGKLRLVWYHMPYLKNTLKPGSHYIFRGKVVRKKNGLTMEQPQMFSPEAYLGMQSRMQPVYGQTKGLENKTITSAVEQALALRRLEKDYLPNRLRIANELAEYNFALRSIHFPVKKEDLLPARRRLVFDEFFLFILALRQMREQTEQMMLAVSGMWNSRTSSLSLTEWIASLPTLKPVASSGATASTLSATSSTTQPETDSATSGQIPV